MDGGKKSFFAAKVVIERPARQASLLHNHLCWHAGKAMRDKEFARNSDQFGFGGLGALRLSVINFHHNKIGP